MTAESLRQRTVLVTREEPDDGPRTTALVARGATVRRVPLLETRPPEDASDLAEAASRIADFDWVVVTSARAVEALAEAAGTGATPRIAAVGEGTARAVRNVGWEPSVIGTGGAVALAQAFDDRKGLEGSSVLFPAADRARPETAQWLREAGALVCVVTAYRTVAREGAAAELAAALAATDLDAAVFTSTSTADGLVEAADVPALRIRLGAIGPTTRARLEAAGAYDLVTPAQPTFEALAQALARALGPG